MKTVSTKGFEAVVRSNLTGGFIFMREVFNRCMEARGGAIVNIIADIWHGWPDYAHSGAARGGMLTLTETAACEWATAGVRVNCVAPGGIASSGFDTYTPEGQGQDPRVPAVGAAAALRHRGRDCLGHRLPAVAGRGPTSPASCVRVDGGTPNFRPATWKLQPARNNVPFEGFHRSVTPELLSRKG